MNKSESIKELATALSKFQAEVKNPANSAANPFFKSKYAPLNEILNGVRPLLTKYGLSVLQMPGGDSQETSITTLLMHESGEWIESDPLTMKAVKNDPQGAGSVITYARRYSLSAILGISSEDDDDANHASGNDSTKDEKPTETKGKKSSSQKTTTESSGQPLTAIVTEAQIKRLFAISRAHACPDHVIKTEIEKLGKSSSKELNKAEYDKICAFAENYKLTQEDAAWDDLSDFVMPE